MGGYTKEEMADLEDEWYRNSLANRDRAMVLVKGVRDFHKRFVQTKVVMVPEFVEATYNYLQILAHLAVDFKYVEKTRQFRKKLSDDYGRP